MLLLLLESKYYMGGRLNHTMNAKQEQQAYSAEGNLRCEFFKIGPLSPILCQSLSWDFTALGQHMGKRTPFFVRLHSHQS